MVQMVRKEFTLDSRQASRIMLLADMLGVSQANVVGMAVDMIAESVFTNEHTVAGKVSIESLKTMAARSELKTPAQPARGATQPSAGEEYDPGDAWKEMMDKAWSGYYIRTFGSDGGEKFDRESIYADRLDSLSR